jgi:hypothetical protein
MVRRLGDRNLRGHSAITNAAAVGVDPHALMTRSGHSAFSTTGQYVNLAGETFRSEAEKHEARVSAKQYKQPVQSRGCVAYGGNASRR